MLKILLTKLSLINIQFLLTLICKLKPGEKILLMAPSGWGKTTLLRLMLGLKRPVKGKILINGENVTGDWAKAHNYFSYVNQKPFYV